MPQPTEDDWVLDEAEALMNTDGLWERLDVVIADLRNGKVQPVDPATTRAQIEQHIQDRRPR